MPSPCTMTAAGNPGTVGSAWRTNNEPLACSIT